MVIPTRASSTFLLIVLLPVVALGCGGTESRTATTSREFLVEEGAARSSTTDTPSLTREQREAIFAQNRAPARADAQKVFADAAGKIVTRPDEDAVNCIATAIKVFACNARPSGMAGTELVAGEVRNGIASDVTVVVSGDASPGGA